jgi:hypothetical protein
MKSLIGACALGIMVTVGLSGCAETTNPGQRAAGGALIGGGAGAAIGAIAGGGSGALAGGLIGAGAGALGGYATTPEHQRYHRDGY